MLLESLKADCEVRAGGRILYMLLGSVSIAAIVVGLLSYRSFFTPRRHQLREFSSLSGPARGDTVG